MAEPEETLFFTIGGKLFRKPWPHEIEAGKALSSMIVLRRDIRLDGGEDARRRVESLTDIQPNMVVYLQRLAPLQVSWDVETATLIPVPMVDNDIISGAHDVCVVCGRPSADYVLFGEPTMEGSQVVLACECRGCKSEYNIIYSLAGAGGGIKVFGTP